MIPEKERRFPYISIKVYSIGSKSLNRRKMLDANSMVYFFLLNGLKETLST